MKIFLKGLLYLSICIASDALYAKKTAEDDASISHPLEIKTGTSKIIDVSHHVGPFGERITFRFNGVPIFNQLPSRPGSEEQEAQQVQEYHFFLPQTVLKGEATKRFVSQMNVTTHTAYNVSLEAVSLPMEGLLLTVKFDPSKVGFQLESGISPKGEPSITLTFHDRTALHAIGSQHNTVLRTAYLQSGVQVKKKYV